MSLPNIMQVTAPDGRGRACSRNAATENSHGRKPPGTSDKTRALSPNGALSSEPCQGDTSACESFALTGLDGFWRRSRRRATRTLPWAIDFDAFGVGKVDRYPHLHNVGERGFFTRSPISVMSLFPPPEAPSGSDCALPVQRIKTPRWIMKGCQGQAQFTQAGRLVANQTALRLDALILGARRSYCKHFSTATDALMTREGAVRSRRGPRFSDHIDVRILCP